MIYLYDSVCTPCVRKPLWKAIRAKAAEQRELVKRLDVTKDPQAKEDAQIKYGLPLPFVVIDGVAKSVEEFLG